MKYIVTAGMLVFFISAHAQEIPVADHPKDYFRNPLAVPMSLAANFGELRSNHYHMGLDIRTQHRENLPVYAAADGEVARVVIEPFGFGQAIYIRHPNGYSTLYAHLNSFYAALAEYVSAQQYKLGSWQVDLEIPPGLFPVRKGDMIALSGNRGGSQGPHLHFEIRRTSDETNQNPLLWGLPVPDKVAPSFVRLAVYDRTMSTYEQSPRLLAVRRAAGGGAAAAGRGRKAGSAAVRGSAGKKAAADAAVTRADAGFAVRAGVVRYTVTPSLILVGSPKVSFAIGAFDTQTGSTNPNGLFQAVLYDNGRPLTGFQMDNISYRDTRNINAHIDYKTKAAGGPWLQHLSQLPGYPAPSIYKAFGGGGVRPVSGGADGVVDCSDGAVHAIRIVLKDANGNESELDYQLQYQPGKAGGVLAAPLAGKLFHPGMLDGVETGDCAFYLGEKSLYDSVHIGMATAGFPGAGHSLAGAVSAVHHIGATYIPLLEPMLVRIRPNTDWRDTAREKVVMVNFDGSSKDVVRPEWQGGWASARFRSFGNFQLAEDLEAPVILLQGFAEGSAIARSGRITFTVRDNLEAVRNVRASVDGQWICCTNDKGGAFIYQFDDHCPPGKHLLRIQAEDVAGNKTEVMYNFTRL